MRIHLAASLASALLLAGCASSPNGDSDADTDVSVRPRPDTVDEPRDTEPEDTGTLDTTQPDVPPDIPDRDPTPTDCEVVGDACVPSSIYCAADENAVGFCSRCGDVLRTEACDVMEVCEVISGAGRCRPCEGEECPVLDACEPNTRRCLDYNTVEICGSDGRPDSVADCATGRRCFDGFCGVDGATTAEDCTQNTGADGGCTGMNCICGAEYVETTEGAAHCAAESTLQSGYCSTGACDANGCDYANEMCATFDLSGLGGGGTYCITNEGCSTRNTPCGDRAGMRCTELPGRRAVDAPVLWEWACWTPVSTIGDSCSSDSDCIGGICRTSGAVSYCTSECGADADCPSHAACVRDPDGDAYVCLARAEACPRITSEPFNIAQTAPLVRYGSGSVATCYFAN
jgi:hypothetical protein